MPSAAQIEKPHPRPLPEQAQGGVNQIPAPLPKLEWGGTIISSPLPKLVWGGAGGGVFSVHGTTSIRLTPFGCVTSFQMALE